MRLAPPKSVSRTSSNVVALVMHLIRRPTSRTGRYRRWIQIGWHPIPFRGNETRPLQDRFRLVVTIHAHPGALTDVWGAAGESGTALAVSQPHMEVILHVLYDPNRLPQCLHEVAGALHQTARHEIEHLLDEGLLALPGPRGHSRLSSQESWQRSTRMMHWLRERAMVFASAGDSQRAWRRRDLRLLRLTAAMKCSIADYIVSPRELHAFVMGFRAEARYRRVSWDVPMHEYIDAMLDTGRMTVKESDRVRTMLTQWARHVLPTAPVSEDTLTRCR